MLQLILGALPVDTAAISRWGAVAMPLAAETAVKATIILALAWVITRPMRNAAARYWLWAMSLVGVSLLLLLVAVLPSWRVLPAWKTAPAESVTRYSSTASPAAPVTARVPNVDQPQKVVSDQSQAAVPASAVAAQTTSAQSKAISNPTVEFIAPPRSTVAMAGGVRSSAWQSPDWRGWVLLIWAVGIALALLRLAIGATALKVLAARSEPISDEALLMIATTVAGELGVGPVRWLQRRAVLPMTWGLLCPTILLPTEATCWPAERSRAILLHELGHIQRRDCLIGWIAGISASLYWFHPLAWLASRSLARAREAACDDLVLSRSFDPPAYAEHLLQVTASTRLYPLLFAGVPLTRSGELETRVCAILDGQPRGRGLRPVTAMLLSFCAVLATSVIALTGVRASSPPVGRAVAASAPVAGAARHVSFHAIDRGDIPVAGATLYIGIPDPDWTMDRKELASAVTDADGNAAVDLAAGTDPLTITAVAPGYAVSIAADVQPAGGNPIPIRMDPGQMLTGSVRHPDGSPVANAEVRAQPANPPSVKGEVAALSGKSDGAGRFQFAHTAAGLYQVSVVPIADDPAYFESQAASVVTDTVPQELTFTGRPSAVVRGRLVTTHAAAPVSGVIVYAHQRIPIDLFWQAKTAADGSFAISGLSPKSVGEIAFANEGSYLAVVDWPNAPPTCRLDPRTIHFVDLAAGEHAGLLVHLYKPATINAAVIDDAGKPFGKAQAAIEPEHQVSKTDDVGQATIKVPPMTQLRMRLSNEAGFEWGAASEPLMLREGETVAKSFSLKPEPQDSPPGNQEISGQIVDPSGHPVTKAMVMFENRLTVASRAMNARSGVAAARSWEGGYNGPAYLQSDAEGRFKFNLLSPGQADIWVDSDRRAFGHARNVKVGTSDLKIVVQPADAKDAVFAGTITNDDGTPAVGARISLFGGQTSTPERTGQTISDAGGHFLVRSTDPIIFDFSSYFWLVARTTQGRSVWKLVGRGGAADLDLHVLPDATASGRVLDERGKPVADARIRLIAAVSRDLPNFYFNGAESAFAPEARSAADGTFTLHGLPPGGSVLLDVDHAGYLGGGNWFSTMQLGSTAAMSLAPETVFNGSCSWTQVQPGLHVPDMVLLDGITLSGIVRYAGTGKPVVGAALTLSDGFVEHHATTDASGLYVIGGPVGLDPYHYTPHITVVAGAGPGGAAAYESSFDYTQTLYPGDRVTGIDISLEPTVANRQAAWLKQPVAPIPSRYRAAIVEPAAGNVEGKDALVLLNGDGSARWSFAGLRAKYDLWHCLTADPADGSVYVLEGTSGMHDYYTADATGLTADHPERQLTKFAADGRIVWQKVRETITLLGVDPHTQDLWVRDGGIFFTYQGDVHVLSRNGDEMTKYDRLVADAKFFAHRPGVWVLGGFEGRKLSRLDQNGSSLAEAELSVVGENPTVSVNDADGSAWVCERKHPQIPGSADRLWVVGADGRVLRKVETPGRTGRVVLDPPRDVAWQETENGIQRVAIKDGQPIGDAIPIGGSIVVEPDTGCIWVAGEAGVARIAPDGRPIWFHPTPGGTYKAIVVVPG